MQLLEISIFVLIAVLLRLFVRGKSRGWILLAVSVLAIYWLQPAMPIRYLDFWLPTFTIAITVYSWIVTTKDQEYRQRINLLTALLIIGLVLAVALTRFLSFEGIITANRPPNTFQVIIGLLVFSGLALLLGRFNHPNKTWLWILFVLVLAFFLVLKVPYLSQLSSISLRALIGQSTATASPLDIRWLGFSYVAFRLIHTIRDRQNNRLPDVSLQEYVNYVIFFPAFTAGPIDRLPRFIKDLQQPLVLESSQIGMAFYRLAVGIFKKFALADTLALISLSQQNAARVDSFGWTWILIYAYAFQIYFDFAGYTDIAIGIGMLLGVQLPENFNRPYLKPNITQFWNNWHMTLTQWFRAYFFNPFTRFLRTKYRRLSVTWIILITQLSTMVLIGLWHGVTGNFVLWGLWHGLGLFVQNRFADWVKPKLSIVQDRPSLQRFLDGFNTVLTFHFVALGWIWFALPTISLSWNVVLQSFGLGL